MKSPAYIWGMEPSANTSKTSAVDPDLLRRYRIYNPSLYIAPMEPGTARLYPETTAATFRRAREWSASEWPESANVAIATGARNHLLVVSTRDRAVFTSFVSRMIDEDSLMTQYAVNTPYGIQCYLRTRLDRAPASTRMSDLKRQGLDVFGEGRYVPGAGSVISGAHCKTVLDTTLDVSATPEPSRALADFLGLPEISAHPSFTPRLRLI